jgi:hypothetical protein
MVLGIPCGNSGGSRTHPVPAFSHAAPALDLPTAVLLAQDDLSTRLMVLTLN